MTRPTLTLFQKALVLIAVPLLFQLVFVFMLFQLRQQVEQENEREVHAREIYRHLDRMLRNVVDRSMESIVGSVTKQIGFEDKEFQNRLDLLTTSIHNESAAIREFVAGNEEERKAFAECDALQQQLADQWASSKDLFDSGNRLGAWQKFKSTQVTAHKLLDRCDSLSAAERNVESSQVAAEVKHRDQIELLIKSAVALNILLAIGLAFFFNIGTTSRLNVLLDNIVRFSSNSSLNPTLTGNDEIAELDRSFHGMADALAVAARQERAIIDKTMDVICSLNAGGKFTRVSPAALQVWGYDPSDLLGRYYLDLIPDAEKQKAIAAMREIKGGHREEPIETQVTRKDGRRVETMWSARWSEEDQTTFCVAHDITARKQTEKILQEAEARVRLIVESLPIGLLIIDKSGLIEFTNPCLKRMFGYSAAELHGNYVAKLFALPRYAIDSRSVGESKGSKISAAVSDSQRSDFNETLFENGRKAEPWETDLVKFDGSGFPAEVSLTEFSTAAGERFLLVILDATQKHAVERMRQEFITMVSHDLRTPLTSVQTFLNLLETGICGELNEKGQRKLVSANRSVERLVDLIRDLLDLERFRSGILIVDPVETSLQSLIERCVDAVKLQSEQLGIDVKMDVPDVQIRADAGRMVQAIVNLVSNSLKFSPRGSLVNIVGKADGDWLNLKIIDQGKGISEIDQLRIFERFQQVHEQDADFKLGSGLGLPICKAIIEQHGGTIGVESKKGEGSCFWLRLPLGNAE
jgi:PAS domain S-box-containing protein